MLAQALASATTIPSDSNLAEALRAGAAPPAGQQPAVLAQALAAATTIPDDSPRRGA